MNDSEIEVLIEQGMSDIRKMRDLERIDKRMILLWLTCAEMLALMRT